MSSLPLGARDEPEERRLGLVVRLGGEGEPVRLEAREEVVPRDLVEELRVGLDGEIDPERRTPRRRPARDGGVTTVLLDPAADAIVVGRDRAHAGRMRGLRVRRNRRKPRVRARTIAAVRERPTSPWRRELRSY